MTRALLALLALAGLVAPDTSAAQVTDRTVHVATERLDLTFSLDGAALVAWRACHPSCAHADRGLGTALRFADPRAPSPIRLRLGNTASSVDLERLRFTAELSDAPHRRTVSFHADLPDDGVRIVKSFDVSKEGYDLVLTVRLLGSNAAAFAAGQHQTLELDAGRGLTAAPTAGSAAMPERVGRVRIAGGAARAIEDDPRSAPPLGAGEWVGARSRFWALLARPDRASVLEPRPDPGIALRSEGTSWSDTLYSGPVESRALARTDPALEALLFSGLWSPLRALSFGLLHLLRGLGAILSNPGLAITALALSVKLLLLPLTLLAERLQEQVNATQARLQPGIDAIRAAHRGEERTRKIWGLSHAEGVHPLDTL